MFKQNTEKTYAMLLFSVLSLSSATVLPNSHDQEVSRGKQVVILSSHFPLN